MLKICEEEEKKICETDIKKKEKKIYKDNFK